MEADMNVVAKLSLGKTEIIWQVCIAPIRDDILIGMDLLKEVDGIIMARQGDLLIKDELIPGRYRKETDYQISRVTVAMETTLEPMAETNVIGRVDRPKESVVGVLDPASLQNEVVDIDSGDPDTDNRDIEIPDYTDSLPEYLGTIMDSTGDNITSHQKQEVARLLMEFKTHIAKNDEDWLLSGIQHQIMTGEARPIRPLGFQGEEKAHLDKLLQSETVIPSHSEWSAPVVLVRKKDGGIRWCIDYRKINAVTSKDSYPLPNIEECLDTLAGASVFSTLDLQSGYHKIEVAPEDRCKTAFTTRYGLFEYTRMPFGLCGAPGTFQRVMELVLRGLQWEMVLIYLDDVIIASPDFESHISHLTHVFERFSDHGLKLKPIKCKLFEKRVLFLGHYFSARGIETNSGLTDTVKIGQFPPMLRSFRHF
ncbi:Hypothetical predicted protein [Mytilus galloprovincialis]|uniref:Reverse transcriptase domain-containing protein n=1 Tax=Mytilus galloprovincialis TaxID=29158 RepID=A0A8B6D5C4_MYTGA|nr:Hypothetical predicted protein [Mytilus galloprovincialis]